VIVRNTFIWKRANIITVGKPWICSADASQSPQIWRPILLKDSIIRCYAPDSSWGASSWITIEIVCRLCCRYSSACICSKSFSARSCRILRCWSWICTSGCGSICAVHGAIWCLIVCLSDLVSSHWNAWGSMRLFITLRCVNNILIQIIKPRG